MPILVHTYIYGALYELVKCHLYCVDHLQLSSVWLYMLIIAMLAVSEEGNIHVACSIITLKLFQYYIVKLWPHIILQDRVQECDSPQPIVIPHLSSLQELPSFSCNGTARSRCVVQNVIQFSIRRAYKVLYNIQGVVIEYFRRSHLLLTHSRQ